MFTSDRLRAAMLVLLLVTTATAAGETPNLGEPLSEAALEALDFTVLPDGEGLPAGSGTAAEGEALYRQHCLACHGAAGEGGANDRLAGGIGSIAGDRPVKTVGSYWPYATTLFDYIRRAMPYQAPGSLSADQVYAVTAYVLRLNGIVPADARLDAKSLTGIEMPNREGFVWAVPSE
jgi:mono/diheme cytochrome c family protein